MTEKVTSMKFQLSDIETRAEKMRETLHYQKSKDSLYGALETLRKLLLDNQEYLSNLNSLAVNSQNADTLITECSAKERSFECQSSKIEELRRLAGKATLHPGAVSDPSNSIKSDLYKFCESWEDLERQFASALDRLRSAKQKCVAEKNKVVEIFVEEVQLMEDNFRQLKSDKSIDVNLLAEFESLLSNVRRFNEEVEGLNVW